LIEPNVLIRQIVDNIGSAEESISKKREAQRSIWLNSQDTVGVGRRVAVPNEIRIRYADGFSTEGVIDGTCRCRAGNTVETSGRIKGGARIVSSNCVKESLWDH
jgi:hypothetical protein